MNHVRPSKKRVAFEVALLEKKHIAEGTIAFIFEKPNGFPLRAGQHVRMTLIDPPETDSEGNSRFFSLANSPGEADLVIALRMRDTAFKRVLGSMPIGDKVRIETLLKSPHGSFALHDDASKPAVFLIGGIGIVPAFSMIKDALERKLPHPLFLFYSNRRAEDAPFLDELETLAKQHPSFTLVATLTEPEKEASSWRGETGHIDHAMIQRYVDDLTSPIYYIAGLPDMVSAMKTVLTASGVSKDNIRAEEFTGFTTGQDGPRGQHGMTHSNNRRIRPLLLVAMVLLLPDAATWLAFFDRVYDTYRKDGLPKAMHQFASGVMGSVDQQVIEQSMAKHANESTMANAAYWMEHEVRQYPRVELDLDALAAHARQLVLVGGRDSRDQMTYQPNKVLARQLGLNLIDVPGGHLGFMASPAEFAKELRDALGGGSH